MQQIDSDPRSWCFWSMLPSLPTCLVTASLLAPFASAWSATPADTAAPLDGSPSTKASFAHSGLKTVTYEIGNTLNNFAFLTAGTGELTGGVLLTAFNTLQSWTVYTTNDYLWERLYPRTTSKDATASFDVKQSFWHTSLKYMTGKPVVASIKIAAVYVYTGSAVTALVYGAAATAGASVIFFVNNLAWDFYDQMAAPPSSGHVHDRPPVLATQTVPEVALQDATR
jgi:uncharacterized membrane protein